MLEIFRRNLFINSVLLLPYIFIVRLSTLIHPVAFNIGKDANVLQKMIFVNVANPLIQNIIVNILIFLQALIINHIFIRHKLSKEITLFAGLFYVIFVSLVKDNNMLSNVLIANTFIILALNYLLQTYKIPQATAYIFNSGFLIGVASIYYSPYFAFLLFGVVALLQLRSFKIVEKIQFFTGAITPYFLLFTYRYWYDIPFVELNFIKDIFFRLPVLKTDSLLVFYVSVIILFLILIFSLINYGSFTAKKIIQTQKKIDIIYWHLLFCLISYFIFSSENVSHMVTLATPLSILFGISVSDTKHKVLYELLHILLISLIFISGFNLINF